MASITLSYTFHIGLSLYQTNPYHHTARIMSAVTSFFCFLMLVMGAAIMTETASAQKFGVYTLTMTSPNLLNVFSGDFSTGHITFVEAIATGGNGTGVQSQNALTVFGNYIFAVNPLSNSLSCFWINPQDPTIVKLVGNPINTQGDYPDTVTASKFTHSSSSISSKTSLSPDAQAACVANTGANSGIACFTYNATTGLTLIQSSVQALSLGLTTPPGFHQGPGQIAFTPNNTGLVLVVKGRNPPVYFWPGSDVAAFTKTPATSGPNGVDNFAFAFDSDSTLVLADTSPYNNGSGVIVVNLNTAGAGTVAFGTPDYFVLPNLQGSCWIRWSPVTTHFYVSNTASGVITELAREGSSLSIVHEILLTNVSNPSDQVILNDFLFVNNAKLGQIWVLQLGGAGGGTWVQRAPNLGSGSGIAGFIAQPAPLTSTTSTPSSSDGVRSGGASFLSFFGEL